MWLGIIWLRMETSGGFFGFHKSDRNFLNISATIRFSEGLYPSELVSL
jgi:hypothetical protein